MMPNDVKDQYADITSDGDVVLIVGADKVRLRVSSECLRYASKIFRAMFGPDWYEGQRLSKDCPTDVELPEDDAYSMWILCSLIHYRNDLVPDHLTSREILQMSIAVDKYDLKLSLKHVISGWLKPRTTTEMVETGQLLAAAFQLQCSKEFMEHTRTLLLDYTESYVDLMKDELVEQVLPSKTYCM
jgi:hypothetical protein